LHKYYAFFLNAHNLVKFTAAQHAGAVSLRTTDRRFLADFLEFSHSSSGYCAATSVARRLQYSLRAFAPTRISVGHAFKTGEITQ